MRIIYTLLLCSLCSFSVIAQSKNSFVLYFDVDQTSPTAASQTDFSSFLKELATLQVSKILVKGHTDKNGNEKYNTRLSQARAEGIAQQIKTTLPKAIVTAEFYGEQDLVTSIEEMQERNRRVQLYITYDAPKSDLVSVQGFFEDVEEQRFSIDLSDTVTIIGKDGTLIKILPKSIQDKNGQLISGIAEVRLREYYDAGDIVLAGMHSSAKEGLLQTGGMFKFYLLQNGDTLSAKTRKPVEIRMPVRNNQLKNMNIFSMPHNSADTARWQNTNVRFNMFRGYWEWPQIEKLKAAVPEWDVRLENWRVGSTYSYEPYKGPWICINCGDEYPVKSILFTAKKISSDSLRVHVKARYRRRAQKRFGQSKLDTTYIVRYRRAEYQGFTDNLNWINCDRFYNYPNVTDFYVSTPGFKGMNVLAYFKRLNAFMLADVSTNGFRIARVPENEEVYIVAFGKKGNAYFFGTHPYNISKNGMVSVPIAKMDEENFKKEMKAIQY